MKNLIYTIANQKYYPILNCFLSSIRRQTDIDICIFTQEGEKDFFPNQENLFLQKLKNLDVSYYGKYSIQEFERIGEYENFLYLDCDHICLKPLDPIFEIISNDDECIQGVLDYHKIDEHSYEHQILDNNIKHCCDSKTPFVPNNFYLKPAYNAGAFGFNKKFIKHFEYNGRFHKFVECNSQLTLTDQPLFNEFFSHYTDEVLKPSLSKHFYLDCMCERHEEENQKKKIEEILLIHVLDGFGNRDSKFRKMKDIMKQEKMI